MKKKAWIIALLATGILAAAFSFGPALAHGPEGRDASPPGGDGWGDMEEDCHGAGGMGGWGMQHGYHMGLGDPVTLERVSDALGLTYDELVARLTGQTIAEVAETQGVALSLVVEAILAPEAEILQVRVKYGYLTEEQAEAVLEEARQHVVEVLTTSFGGDHGDQCWMDEETDGTGGYQSGNGGGWGARRGRGGMMGGGMMGGGRW